LGQALPGFPTPNFGQIVPIKIKEHVEGSANSKDFEICKNTLVDLAADNETELNSMGKEFRVSYM
jgi:hypothetical protein